MIMEYIKKRANKHPDQIEAINDYKSHFYLQYIHLDCDKEIMASLLDDFLKEDAFIR